MFFSKNKQHLINTNHRAWIRQGSRNHPHLDLKLLISYLPNASLPLIRPHFSRTAKLEALTSSEAAPIIPAKKTDQDPGDKIIKDKIIKDPPSSIRLAATILDECETEGHREEYIEALQKHASVHIYGRCGAPCPGWVTEDCLRYLDKHYKVSC
jgi:hypothetical protein